MIQLSVDMFVRICILSVISVIIIAFISLAKNSQLQTETILLTIAVSKSDFVPISNFMDNGHFKLNA